jgi:flagellar hook-associated protein 3 FlgL
MISGIDAFNGSFLADLSSTENRIAQANQQISSGTRVSQASDDPAAVAPILQYQGQIDQITQIQANLTLANADTTTADAALQSASSLMDQLVSMAAQGASTTTSDSARASLAQQVQSIEQQLVSIANTTSRGRYVFGGDNQTTAPYTFDWTAPAGVVQNSTATNTSILRDSSGNTIVPAMTAQQIFDARDSGGNPVSGNIFQAVYALGQALQTNNASGIQNAAAAIKAGVAQLAQATSFYGNVESWIQQASQNASQQLATLKQELSSLRDTDVVAAATQLTLSQTALEASLSAHGNLDHRSLFSYLG